VVLDLRVVRVAQREQEFVELVALLGRQWPKEGVFGVAEGLVGLGEAAFAGVGDRDQVAAAFVGVAFRGECRRCASSMPSRRFLVRHFAVRTS
jgi:hypothetical protein